MQDLIPVVISNINNSEVNSVSAKELHSGLELDKSQWSRWSKKNIVNNEFFLENKDWVGFDIMSNGNETRDFAISLDFAKHLAMMARTKKSHDYRDYLVQCEKKLAFKETPIAIAMTPKTAIPYLEGYLDAAKLFQIPLHLAQIESAKLTFKDTNIDFSPMLKLASTQDDIPEVELMLEPTELGKRLGYSAAEMNRVLERLGLQTRPNGKDWVVTDLGEPISFYHSWTKFGKSGYNYKWNVSEVEKLLPKII
jgi:phage anti-repressor protein